MEAENLETFAARICRSKLNAYAAMWGVGQLSLHHGNRLRTALQVHLEHSLGSADASRHHKRRAQVQPASTQQPRKSTKVAAGSPGLCSLPQQGSPSAQHLPIATGVQLLHAAANEDCCKLEQFVQQQGVEVNQQVALLGRTALHAAAEAGHVSCCQLLLERLGADSYLYDNAGVSAMMLAARNGHHKVIRVLLDAGADPFVVDHSGNNALLLAARCGSAQSVKLLLQEGLVDAEYHNSDLGAGEHALLLAAEQGSVECVGLLLAGGARVNRTDKEGRTALWVASRNGHLEVVRVLLAQPHVKHLRHFLTGTTPVMEAQAAGHMAVAALLTAHQAHQQTVRQQTPGSPAAVSSQAQQEHSNACERLQQAQQQQQEQQGRQRHQLSKQHCWQQQQRLQTGQPLQSQPIGHSTANDQAALELSGASELVDMLLYSLEPEDLDVSADDSLAGLPLAPVALVC